MRLQIEAAWVPPRRTSFPPSRTASHPILRRHPISLGRQHASAGQCELFEGGSADKPSTLSRTRGMFANAASRVRMLSSLRNPRKNNPTDGCRSVSRTIAVSFASACGIIKRRHQRIAVSSKPDNDRNFAAVGVLIDPQRTCATQKLVRNFPSFIPLRPIRPCARYAMFFSAMAWS
jgi:hypothetical protein